MPYFGISALKLGVSSSRKKWPDIWVTLDKIPIVVVTREWAAQYVHERRKRLVHEFLHMRGLQHDDKIGYSTIPAQDKYSMQIYNRIIGK